MAVAASGSSVMLLATCSRLCLSMKHHFLTVSGPWLQLHNCWLLPRCKWHYCTSGRSCHSSHHCASEASQLSRVADCLPLLAAGIALSCTMRTSPWGRARRVWCLLQKTFTFNLRGATKGKYNRLYNVWGTLKLPWPTTQREVLIGMSTPAERKR